MENIRLRKNAKKDSGLMYHAVGPNGADGGNWMRSHEFQIQEGDKGKIQIQSEGSEVFYQDIKICSIDKIPENILKDQSMVK